MKPGLQACLWLSLALITASAEEPATGSPAKEKATVAKDGRQIPPQLKTAVEALKLPGVRINLDQWSVDVESRICLREGLLELIACTKDTKEHESIIVIDAKPSHLHAALLLLGAKAGNPAIRRIVDQENGGRFISAPPKGNPVDVLLVFKDGKGEEREHPISDFITRSDQQGESTLPDNAPDAEKARKFPVDPFLFAGSVIVSAETGPRRYICDESGNVISISTFGDELLCMADVHGHDNESLNWKVSGDKLPELNSKVILRLRPRLEAVPAPAPTPPPATAPKVK